MKSQWKLHVKNMNGKNGAFPSEGNWIMLKEAKPPYIIPVCSVHVEPAEMSSTTTGRISLDKTVLSTGPSSELSVRMWESAWLEHRLSQISPTNNLALSSRPGKSLLA